MSNNGLDPQHPSPPPAHPQRTSLWRLPPHCQTLVIAFCLTPQEILKVARQSRYRETPPAAPTALRRWTQQALDKMDGLARPLHKQLDRKYHRQLRVVDESDGAALAGLWHRSLQSEAIAGHFWAQLTHPSATAEWQAELCRQLLFRMAQDQPTDGSQAPRPLLEQRLSNTQQQLQHREQLYQAQCKALEALQQQVAQPPVAMVDLKQQLQQAHKENRQLRKRLDWAEGQLAHREIRITELLQGFEGLKEQLLETVQEREDLEACLKQLLQEQADQPLDLQGYRLVCVGLCRSLSPQIQALIEAFNGSLIDSDNEPPTPSGLLDQVQQADLVFYARERVEPNLCRRLEHFCRDLEKPHIPLKSATLAAFTSALQGWLEGQDNGPMGETLLS